MPISYSVNIPEARVNQWENRECKDFQNQQIKQILSKIQKCPMQISSSSNREYWFHNTKFPNSGQRNWVLAISSNCIIPISLHTNRVNLYFFTIRLLHQIESKVWNKLPLQHWVTKLKGLKIRICGKESISLNNFFWKYF